MSVDSGCTLPYNLLLGATSTVWFSVYNILSVVVIVGAVVLQLAKQTFLLPKLKRRLTITVVVCPLLFLTSRWLLSSYAVNKVDTIIQELYVPAKNTYKYQEGELAQMKPPVFYLNMDTGDDAQANEYILEGRTRMEAWARKLGLPIQRVRGVNWEQDITQTAAGATLKTPFTTKPVNLTGLEHSEISYSSVEAAASLSHLMAIYTAFKYLKKNLNTKWVIIAEDHANFDIECLWDNMKSTVHEKTRKKTVQKKQKHSLKAELADLQRQIDKAENRSKALNLTLHNYEPLVAKRIASLEKYDKKWNTSEAWRVTMERNYALEDYKKQVKNVNNTLKRLYALKKEKESYGSDEAYNKAVEERVQNLKEHVNLANLKYNCEPAKYMKYWSEEQLTYCCEEEQVCGADVLKRGLRGAFDQLPPGWRVFNLYTMHLDMASMLHFRNELYHGDLVHQFKDGAICEDCLWSGGAYAISREGVQEIIVKWWKHKHRIQLDEAIPVDRLLRSVGRTVYSTRPLVTLEAIKGSTGVAPPSVKPSNFQSSQQRSLRFFHDPRSPYDRKCPAMIDIVAYYYNERYVMPFMQSILWPAAFVIIVEWFSLHKTQIAKNSQFAGFRGSKDHSV